MRKTLQTLLLLIFLSGILYAQLNPVPTTLNDFFLAGSQPGQSGNLETPSKCDNCHGGYDPAVEPAHSWRGNMMSQAARDPFFYACMSIANQDAAFAGDLCIRCHSPAGWLEGRSVPTDGSKLNQNDRQGVQCDFCHKLVNPNPTGLNPYPSPPYHPDYTNKTFPRDQTYLGTLSVIPTHSANGMYVADNSNAKRGPFTDATARHQMYYSPFHQDAALCGTCHDVSNPVYRKITLPNGDFVYELNDLNSPPESMSPYEMFPVERTYSEWLMSSFNPVNNPAGVSGTPFGGNKSAVSTCQDCHMRDVTGRGANKNDVPIRNDLPLHDMTGGNTWVPDLLPAFWPGETNAAALADGKQRAAFMLQNAAILEVDELPDDKINIKVINQTGHKLPSGYPEGRRMWINVKFYNQSGQIIEEKGKYDYATADLTTIDTKVYEVKLGMSSEIVLATGRQNLDDGSSFHFVLNNVVVKDNRIPPLGFTNAAFKQIQSPPVAYSYVDGVYFDNTVFDVPSNADKYEVNLYYQTASKEYVTFLRDENRTDDWGNRLYNAWLSSGMSAPVLMASYVSTSSNGDEEPPTPPANLIANAVNFSLVTLVWEPSTDNVGVAGYNIYRTDIGTSPIATVTTTTFSDGSVKANTTYTYYVRAFDDAGNISAPSNNATATTPKRNKKDAVFADGERYLLHGEISLSPNPFNPEATVHFGVDYPGNVQLDVYDLTGRLITTLVNNHYDEGSFNVRFGGNNYATGLYIFVLRITPDDHTIETTVTYSKGILLK